MPSPVPLTVFQEALADHRFDLLNAWVTEQPALLAGDDPQMDRVDITVKALGKPDFSVEEKLKGWTWLATHRFAFPTDEAGANQVLGALLRGQPTAVLDAWRARTADVPIRHALLGAAVNNPSMEALHWWVRQGLPVHAGPDRYPHLFTAVGVHQLDAGEHVQFLLDHGLRPVPASGGQGKGPVTTRDTPLIILTRQYKNKEQSITDSVTDQERERFRALWVTLVTAGDDPHYEGDLAGDSPWAMLQDTPSAAWWDAHLRHSQTAPLTTEPTRQRLRRRS